MQHFKRTLVVYAFLGAFLSGCASVSSYAKNASLNVNENVELTICGESSTHKALEETIIGFNKIYPNCHISYEYVMNYQTSLSKRLAANDDVDCFITSTISSTSPYLPYTDDFKTETSLDLSNTFSGLMENSSAATGDSNKLYFIPFGGEIRGMSEEFQKKMFDPFSQEDRMQTTGNGTGLGLAIVKSFVTLMSGELNVRSAPGVGTTFALSFPLQKSDTPLKNSTISPQEISGLKDKRILLCEDNPLNAKIAKTLLENKGMKVDLASNGKVGLDRFATSQPHTYDLILMDMRMPVMDGLETAKAIRALSREEAKKIPIVAMTANAYDEDIKACLEAGMNAHLAKPVDPTAMYEEIAKQLFLKK